MGQKEEIQDEALREFRKWHDQYVPDHKFGSKDEEVHESDDAKSYIRHIHINHGPELERSINAVKKEICKNENIRHKYSTRFLAIKLLENDKDIEQHVISTLPNGAEVIKIRDKEAERIRQVMNEDSEQAITDAKYGFISGALKETYTEKSQDTEAFTRVVDSIVTHKIWGFPIFFLFLYIMFECTFTFGAYPQEWIEWLVGAIGSLAETYMPAGPLKDLVIDGIIGGVGGVIVFLPNILLLYIFISFMEDTGYMARAAFIMDKIMHKMGLHGKSFIPLIMGFGCNVDVVQCPSAYLLSIDWRLLPQPCQLSIAFALCHWHLASGAHGTHFQQVLSKRRRRSIRYGTPPLPHAYGKIGCPPYVGERGAIPQENGRHHHDSIYHHLVLGVLSEP